MKRPQQWLNLWKKSFSPERSLLWSKIWFEFASRWEILNSGIWEKWPDKFIWNNFLPSLDKATATMLQRMTNDSLRTKSCFVGKMYLEIASKSKTSSIRYFNAELIILHRRLIDGVFSSIRREVFAIPWSNENSLLSFKQFLVGLPVPTESLDIRNSGWPRFRGLRTFNCPWWSRIDQIKNLHIILHFYLTNAPAEEEAEDRVKTFPSKARKSKGGEEELGYFMLVPFYKSHETTFLNFKLQDAKNLRRRINY